MSRFALNCLLSVVTVVSLLAPRMAAASLVFEDPKPQEEEVFHAGDPLPPMPVPASMDEILSSPYFEAEPGHDCAYYLDRAAEIFALCSRYTQKRSEEARNEIAGGKDKSFGSHAKLEEYSLLAVKFEREDSETMCRKFKETLYPHLLTFALSDETPEKEASRAFAYCLDCLRWTGDFDKLEELRREELAKEAKAVADGNEELANRADIWIRSIDLKLYAPFTRLEGLNFNRNEGGDALKEQAVKLGEKILKDFDGDPRMTSLADQFYMIVGHYVDAKIALEFREKILPKFDKEKALKEVERAHGHSAEGYTFALLIEPRPLDESLLKIEPGQTVEYYNERDEQLTKALE